MPLAGEASEMGVVEKTESPLHQRVERLEELLRRSPWNTSLYEECVQALEALGRIDEASLLGCLAGPGAKWKSGGEKSEGWR